MAHALGNIVLFLIWLFSLIVSLSLAIGIPFGVYRWIRTGEAALNNRPVRRLAHPLLFWLLSSLAGCFWIAVARTVLALVGVLR